MTNKEKYKKAFAALHASNKNWEEMEMLKNRKSVYMKKVLAAGAAFAIITGSMSAAYAADLGGIQEKLTMWFHGEKTEVTAQDYGDYSYKYTFTDSDGNAQEFVAGGVEIDDNGNEHPVSAQELLDEFTDEIIYSDNGKIYLFYFDRQKKIDITDLFDKDHICRAAVKDGKKTYYYTIEDNGDDCAGFEKTEEIPKNADRYTQIDIEKH